MVKFRIAACAVIVFFATSRAGDKAAAIVNGEPITVAELDAATAQSPGPVVPISAVQKRQQCAEALHVLIDDKLARQFLRQNGPKIEPAEVEKQFAALIANQKALGKSIDEYLKENSLTAAQMRENLLRILQLTRYVDSLATPERLRNYYDGNRDLFDKTTVRTSHIVIRLEQGATPVERQKSIEKLRSIRSDLIAGRLEFAAAAKAYSQSSTASNGGDMGYIVRKFQADEAYAKAAFSLKVGEISEVVDSDGGLHLIWVTDRKTGKPSRYEDIADDVRECFEAELKQNLVAELRKKAKIEIKLQ